eukprot:evm.model.scf_27.2 EVM.evm.TU.scf_27.2   scf_27:10416-18329(+)
MATVDTTCGVTTGTRRCLATRGGSEVLRRAASGRARWRRSAGHPLVFASAEDDAGRASTVSKTALRKLKKAELASQLLDYGLDNEGTRPQLLQRLLEHLKATDGADSLITDKPGSASLDKGEMHAQKLRRLYKKELVEICRTSGLPTAGTKATLIARILKHPEQIHQPRLEAVPAEAMGQADYPMEQDDTDEFVTEEEYNAQREEVQAELLQKTKVQLQQMCKNQGLKMSARTKMELVERILQALDEYSGKEVLKESVLEATSRMPKAIVQTEVPLRVPLGDSENIARIKGFRDNAKGFASEIDSILEEMRGTYGKYLPADGFLERELPYTAGVGALEEPTVDDLKALENEAALQECLSSSADLLKQDGGSPGQQWAGPTTEKEQEVPAAGAQLSRDAISVGNEHGGGEVANHLDNDENGVEDDELGEGTLRDSLEVDVERCGEVARLVDEALEQSRKPVQENGADFEQEEEPVLATGIGYGPDLHAPSPHQALKPTRSDSCTGDHDFIETIASAPPPELVDIGASGASSVGDGALPAMGESEAQNSNPIGMPESNASEPTGEPGNGDASHGALNAVTTEEEAKPPDDSIPEAEAVPDSTMTGTILEKIEARKAALAQVQERVGAANSSQESTVAQMGRLLEMAEDLKAERSDWQKRMQRKVESLTEVAERMHETEKTKMTLAADLDELENQLEDLENDAEKKKKEAEKLRVAISSPSPIEEDDPHSASAAKESANSHGAVHASPGAAMAAGVLGFVDMLVRISQNARKKGEEKKGPE